MRASCRRRATRASRRSRISSTGTPPGMSRRRSTMRNDVPVVIMKDEGGHGALAVARTLGRLGVKMYLVTEKGPKAVLKSRYWTKTFTWDFKAPREWSVRFMLDLSRQIGQKPILLAIADSSALFIDENVEELSHAYILPRPAPGAMKTLTNK